MNEPCPVPVCTCCAIPNSEFEGWTRIRPGRARLGFGMGGGGGGSGSNRARLPGLVGSASSARRFIALGGGGGLSALLGRCLGAGLDWGVSVRWRLINTASESGESERSWGSLRVSFPPVSSTGEGVRETRAFSFPLVDAVFAGASWITRLGPPTSSRAGALALIFFVCLVGSEARVVIT